jgi:hypothetical protein
MENRLKRNCCTRELVESFKHKESLWRDRLIGYLLLAPVANKM